jgi:biopolymer transport protein ExbD
VASADHQPPQSDRTSRRRARVLIPVAFVVAVVLVLLFIFLVSWLGK